MCGLIINSFCFLKFLEMIEKSAESWKVYTLQHSAQWDSYSCSVLVLKVRCNMRDSLKSGTPNRSLEWSCTFGGDIFGGDQGKPR